MGTPRRSSLRREEARFAALLVAPHLVGSFLIVLVPTIAVIGFSLLDWNSLSGKSSFVGLDNYVQLAANNELVDSIRVTAFYVVGLVVLNLVLSLSLALLLNQRIPGVSALRTLVFLPAAVSLVAWTLSWRLLFQDNGLINSALAQVGIDGPNWLHESTPALTAVIIVQLFKNVGLNMTIFLAGLQGIPRDLLEAAEMDGAGTIARIRYITLPILAPIIFLVVVLTSVGATQVFDTIMVLTRGGPGNSTSVLTYEIYRQAFSYNEIGLGSAVAVVLLALSAALVTAQWGIRRRWVAVESD
jgi:multiple sugar transport system permease protein